MITAQDLSKQYSRKEQPAVDSVNFQVGDGEIVGFVGLNGAGKTTTIRILAGVSLPTRGNALLDGHDIVVDKVEASRRLGWVPEFPNYDTGSTALGLMRYFSGFYNVPTQTAKQQSKDLLDQVGLGQAMGRKLRTFSQGMKKRFSLAASMIADPQNYLFDELLNGLDPEGVLFVRKLMLQLKSNGKSVLLSSHILSEVQELSNRVILIHHGRIVRTLSREEILRDKNGLEDQFFQTIGMTTGVEA